LNSILGSLGNIFGSGSSSTSGGGGLLGNIGNLLGGSGGAGGLLGGAGGAGGLGNTASQIGGFLGTQQQMANLQMQATLISNMIEMLKSIADTAFGNIGH
jgi:hypothetical protein